MGRPRETPTCQWGKKVESLADSLGLSRRQLAEKAGVTQESLRRLLIGANRPRLTTAIRLADALGVSIEELV